MNTIRTGNNTAYEQSNEAYWRKNWSVYIEGQVRERMFSTGVMLTALVAVVVFTLYWYSPVPSVTASIHKIVEKAVLR